MTNEEENRSGLVPVQTTALARVGANSLAARARADLRVREDAQEWLCKGRQLQKAAPEELNPELHMTLEYIKQILAGTQPDVAAQSLDMTPEDQERAHVAHFFMPDALKECALREEERKDQLLEAFRCFERGIQLNPNHPELQSVLGFSYSTGQGVPRDYAQAAAWLRKAAEQGDAKAQYNLGVLYHDSLGVPQDYAQAAVWWRKAAASGDELAQYELRQSAEFYGAPYDDCDPEEPSNLESSKQPEQPTPKN